MKTLHVKSTQHSTEHAPRCGLNGYKACNHCSFSRAVQLSLHCVRVLKCWPAFTQALWKYFSQQNTALVLKYWPFLFKYCPSVLANHVDCSYRLYLSMSLTNNCTDWNLKIYEVTIHKSTTGHQVSPPWEPLRSLPFVNSVKNGARINLLNPSGYFTYHQV